MHDTPRSSASHHSRIFTAFAALMLLALSASACGLSEPTVTTTGAPATADDTGAAVSNDPAPDTSAPADSTASTPSNDGYGDKPVLRAFRISADAIRYSGNPVGFDYTFTEIDDSDADVEYYAIGNDSGVRASYLSTGVDYLHICVETGDGCGGGDPGERNIFSNISYGYQAWAPQSFDDGLRVAGGILLGESVGWEISDPNFSFDGRPGRCYRSLGQYQWQGDPEPTTTSFPAGDIACVLFYETNSEYLVSYDFGGDGTFELATTRLANTYTDADFERPAYAPAGDDPEALAAILDNVTEADQIINQG